MVGHIERRRRTAASMSTMTTLTLATVLTALGTLVGVSLFMIDVGGHQVSSSPSARLPLLVTGEEEGERRGVTGMSPGMTTSRVGRRLRALLNVNEDVAPLPPPPPEPADAFSAVVDTLAKLRAEMTQPKILTVYVVRDIDLNGAELPPVEKPLRVLGACGASGLDPCTLDAGDRSRHFTVGATGTLELHNLKLSRGKATGSPWADGGAAFVYGKLVARRVIFAHNNAKEDGTSSGGAVAVHYGDALFLDCRFEHNAAASNGGAVKVIGKAEFRGGAFEGNAAVALGGGVASDNGEVTVRDVTFGPGNAAREGNSRDVYVGAGGTVYLEPFVFGGVGGYAAGGLGRVERAPFLPPPPPGAGRGGGFVVVPPPPPDGGGANPNRTDGTGIAGDSGGGGGGGGGGGVLERMSAGGIAGTAVAVLVLCAGGGVAYVSRVRRRLTAEREIAAEHDANERALKARDEELEDLRRRAIVNQKSRTSAGGRQGGEEGKASLGDGGDDGAERAEGEEEGYRDGAPRGRRHSSAFRAAGKAVLASNRFSEGAARGTDRGARRSSAGSIARKDLELEAAVLRAHWAGAAAEEQAAHASEQEHLGGAPAGRLSAPRVGRPSTGSLTSGQRAATRASTGGMGMDAAGLGRFRLAGKAVQASVRLSGARQSARASAPALTAPPPLRRASTTTLRASVTRAQRLMHPENRREHSEAMAAEAAAAGLGQGPGEDIQPGPVSFGVAPPGAVPGRPVRQARSSMPAMPVISEPVPGGGAAGARASRVSVDGRATVNVGVGRPPVLARRASTSVVSADGMARAAAAARQPRGRSGAAVAVEWTADNGAAPSQGGGDGESAPRRRARHSVQIGTMGTGNAMGRSRGATSDSRMSSSST